MKGTRIWAAYLAVIGLIFAASLPVAAQVNTADLVGKVSDPTGAVVPGAKIKVTNPATGFARESVTGETGHFAVPQLMAGTYKVTVEASGFTTSVYEKVELAVGAKQELDVILKVGSGQTTLTVTEETPLVELTSSEIRGSVSELEVKELPILDRNFAGLTYIVPGIRPAQSFDPTKSRVGNFSVNGSDGRAVDVNVDGADNKDNVVGGLLQNFTIEGIQEFNVITNRYSAESGRAVGTVVNVVNKSGTNEIHGTLFGLFQVSTLNRQDFFSKQGGNPKPVFHRYHFGGSGGGALIKDKLFVFGAYEHKREPGSIGVEPNAFTELSLFPLAVPVRTLPFPYLDHLITVKLDYRISDVQNLSVRYGRQRWENPNDQLGDPFTTDLTQAQGNTNQLHDLSLQHNWNVASNKVNTISAHFQDSVNEILAAPGRTFTLNVFGGTTTTNPRVFFPAAEIGQNVNVPQQTLIRKYQFRDDFSWVLNHHTLKFGANYIYLAKLGGFFFFGANGYEIGFGDNPSQITGCTAVSATCPNAYPQGFATPGAVQSLNFSGGDGAFNQRPHQIAFYAQDDYKITPRLTLNLGVRWDGNLDFLPKQLGSTATDTNRTIGILRTVLAANPSGAGTTAAMARIRQIVGDDSLLRRTNASVKEFQPRVGFAWDPTGRGKHVIRGGYGIAYDQVFQNLTLFSLQQANPTIYQTIITLTALGLPGAMSCPPNLALTPQQDLCQFRFGVDALPAPPPGLTTLFQGAFGRINDPRMTDPYVQQSSIGWAWEFRPDFSFSADYYHTLGIHESRVININPRILPVCGASTIWPGSTPADPRCVRGGSTRFLDPAFAAVAGVGAGIVEQTNMIGTTNRSRFDSLNVQVKKRFSRKYMFQASYVLSKSQSWGGRPTASYSGNGIAVIPERQFASDQYGPSIFDERHRFVFSGHFLLPWGFEVSPLTQFASARPFNFRAGIDVDGDGRLTVDTVCVGSTLATPLNNTRLCPEIRPNALRGDNLSQVDLRMAKAFKFRERIALRLYYEIFNLFNTNNFGNNFGANSRSASTFNKPLGYDGGQGFGPATSGPLRSQFGFRFEF